MLPTEQSHLLVPIASLEDAERTCPKLAAHLTDAVEVVTIVHVIEHTEGYIDPASPVALEEDAERLFECVEDYFDDGPDIQRELRYGTDAVEEIIATADDLDVSAIGFAPRPKSRLAQLLRNNSSYRLITESHHPVVTFSRGGDDS